MVPGTVVVSRGGLVNRVVLTTVVVGVHMGVVVVSTVVANTCVANTVSALAAVCVTTVVVVDCRLVTTGCSTNVSVTVLTVDTSTKKVVTVVGVLEVEVKKLDLAQGKVGCVGEGCHGPARGGRGGCASLCWSGRRGLWFRWCPARCT